MQGRVEYLKNLNKREESGELNALPKKEAANNWGQTGKLGGSRGKEAMRKRRKGREARAPGRRRRQELKEGGGVGFVEKAVGGEGAD